MAKVVTSEGLKDFVESGKPTEVIAAAKRAAPGAAAPLEMKANTPAPMMGESATEPAKEPEKVTASTPEPEDTGLEAEDHDLAERAKKRIGKKHYEMKKAQEAADQAREQSEADARLAENLFNEREMWRKRAEEAEKKVTPPPAPVEIKAPDESDAKYKKADGTFDLRQFIADSSAFAADQAVAKDRKAQQEAIDARAREAAAADFKKRIEAAEKKYPDWKRVVETSTIEIQNEGLQYIAQSEYGTDLAYYLAKNPAVAEKIRAMHPIRAIAELGKIETSLEKPANSGGAEKTAASATSPATPQTVERQGAPAPITPIATSGTGSIVVDPAKMDFKQLREYERQRNKRR